MIEEHLAPVLRVADVAASIAWFHRLGFDVEVEHSITREAKRTTAVLKRGKLRLILSDREEDGKPNAVIWMYLEDLQPIETEFNAPLLKNWLGQYVELRDPDGNRICVVTTSSKLTPIPGRYIRAS